MMKRSAVIPRLPITQRKKQFSFDSLLRDFRRQKMLYLFLVPTLACFLLFNYLPMYGTILAFKDYNLSLGIWDSPWVGLEHFRQLFSGNTFPQVIQNSITINFYKLLVGFPAPILLAVLLNEITNTKFKKVSQSISYFPYFLSWVVLYGIFMDFLSPSSGPINQAFKGLGLQPVFFLGNPNWFRLTLVLTSVWKSVGYGSIMYMAAIIGVNPELYEAAIMDGASRIKRIIHITIPSIVPMITIMLVLNIGNLIKDDFDQIWNFLNAAVLDKGDVIATYVYRNGILNFNVSYATAAGLFQNLIAMILVLSANFVTKRINDYGLW